MAPPRSGPAAQDAAEAEMAGGAVLRLALPGGGPVAQAVVGCAQVRAALDDHTPEPDATVRAGLPGPGRARPGSTGRAASALRLSPVPRREVVAGPFPDVAGHVVEPVAVRGERAHRRGALVAVGEQVLPGELTLPGVGHHDPIRRELIAPGVGRAVQAAPGRVLPLRLGGQFLAGPRGVRLGVFVGDVGHRMALPAAAVAAGPLRVAPAGAGDVS